MKGIPPEVDDIAIKAEKITLFQHRVKRLVSSSKSFKASLPLKHSPFNEYVKLTKASKRNKLRSVLNLPIDDKEGQNLVKSARETKKCCEDQAFRLEHLKKILLEGQIHDHQVTFMRHIDLKHLSDHFHRMGFQIKACLQKKIAIKAHRITRDEAQDIDPYLMRLKKKGDLKVT